MKPMRERILITGPGGRVGTHIVPLLRQHYSLRLFDFKALSREEDDEVVQADIRDFDALRDACKGVRAMVHLAAVPDEDDFNTRLLPMNLSGVYNAFEAARQAGLRKVVFASTGQTVLNYGRGVWVSPDMPVRPSTVYACTKVFGEALARNYSDCHGMSMICIRICWFQGYDSDVLRHTPEILPDWCSPRDLTQLIVKSIQTDLPFGIFFGISNNTGRQRDISNAQKLVGYEPQDNAADFSHVGKRASS
jgi:nucleoside-diphosphate-sugar epimerase